VPPKWGGIGRRGAPPSSGARMGALALANCKPIFQVMYYRADSRRRFFLNESFVRRTITGQESLVEKQITAAKRNEFKQRV
jgi:hypothetical protein